MAVVGCQGDITANHQSPANELFNSPPVVEADSTGTCQSFCPHELLIVAAVRHHTLRFRLRGSIKVVLLLL